MTTEEKLASMISTRAVSKNDIDKMMPLIKKKINSSVKSEILWNAPAKGYDNAVLTVFFITAKPVIVKWFEKNKPEAFQLQMFK